MSRLAGGGVGVRTVRITEGREKSAERHEESLVSEGRGSCRNSQVSPIPEHSSIPKEIVRQEFSDLHDLREAFLDFIRRETGREREGKAVPLDLNG